MCPVRFLHSDSSDQVWAGLDTTTNTAVQDFWRDKSMLHINEKELQAAVHTIKKFGQTKGTLPPLCGQFSGFCLSQEGGRLPHLNRLMRDLWAWCMERQIVLHPGLVKSSEEKADFLTRQGKDCGDFTLYSIIFQLIHQKL